MATDPARYLVTFLPEAPDPARVDALPPADGGDYLVRGRELYLWLPDGIQNTPLASWKWDRLLGSRHAPERPATGTPWPAGLAGAERPRAHPSGSDTRRRRFGEARQRAAYDSCSACHPDGGRELQGDHA